MTDDKLGLERLRKYAAAEKYRRALINGEPVGQALGKLKEASEAIAASMPQKANEDATVVLATPPKSSFLSADATGIDARAEIGMTHVPLALVHSFDPVERPLVTVHLKNASDRILRLRVRCFVEGYSAEFVDTVELERRDEEKTLELLPTFRVDASTTLSHPVRATAHLEVSDLDKHKIEIHKSFRIWLLPRTTTILWEQEPVSGKWKSRGEYLACWVTPDSEQVMQVLRAATGDGEIVGYQVDAKGVEEQVERMFNALKECELRYVNSVLATGANDAFVQRVRLPFESIERKSANCLDGTVLFASLMEAASLEPGIVLVPGHAFVAWKKEPNGDWDYLETTLTGYSPFERALEAGRKAHQEWGPQATVYDVAKLRSDGFQPMA